MTSSGGNWWQWERKSDGDFSFLHVVLAFCLTLTTVIVLRVLSLPPHFLQTFSTFSARTILFILISCCHYILWIRRWRLLG
jgi:hypothetical protein